MKKILYVAVVAAMLSACTADLEDKQVAIDSNPISAKILNGSSGCVGGSIVVRFTPSAESRLAECATRSGVTRTGISGVDAVLDDVSGYSVEPMQSAMFRKPFCPPSLPLRRTRRPPSGSEMSSENTKMRSGGSL